MGLLPTIQIFYYRFEKNLAHRGPQIKNEGHRGYLVLLCVTLLSLWSSVALYFNFNL